MTQKSIDEQIEVLKAVAEKFSASREAASDFLKSAGIYTGDDDQVHPHKDSPFSKPQTGEGSLEMNNSHNRNRK